MLCINWNGIHMGKWDNLGVDFFRDRQLITTLTNGSDRDAAILCGAILEEISKRCRNYY